MCIKCGSVHLAAKPLILEPEMERVAKLIHEGKMAANQIDKKMVRKIARQLMKGIFQGFGTSLANDSLSKTAKSFLSQVTQNVYVFSGFKNYHQLRETSLLLKTDDGVLKPFNQFLNEVKQVNKTYNEVYLEAEYSNAVASAQSAASMIDYKDNGIEMLEFVDAGDRRVRNSHHLLNGAIYAIDDPFWDMYDPPLDWGCRCDKIPAVGKKPNHIASGDLPEIPEMFKFSPAKTGTVFPDTHPYYDTSKAAAREIRKQVNDILNEED